MPLTVGGGVRSLQDVRDLLNAGADKVSIMTAAVENPELVGEAAVKIGSANLVVAIDCARPSGRRRAGRSAPTAGAGPTGLDAVEWAARMAEAGAGEILLTSMDRDGTRSGYDLALLRAVADRVSVPVIASGGGGSAEDLARGAARRTRRRARQAALAASIFHFRRDHGRARSSAACSSSGSRCGLPRLMPRRPCARVGRALGKASEAGDFTAVSCRLRRARNGGSVLTQGAFRPPLNPQQRGRRPRLRAEQEFAACP